MIDCVHVGVYVCMHVHVYVFNLASCYQGGGYSFVALATDSNTCPQGMLCLQYYTCSTHYRNRLTAYLLQDPSVYSYLVKIEFQLKYIQYSQIVQRTVT